MPEPATGPRPDCKVGARGEQVCGYNCHLGSDGQWYCATTPQGQCARESDGTWMCP